MVITTLAHHIDLAWMYEAYRQTRKSGAVGVDKVTAEEYAADLESNLKSLLDRFKSGTYFAPPVRRVEIPKGDGKQTRPIGVPTFEDKVLQRAVAMVLEAVYEQDFCDCSYGFRPGRSAHDAIETLWKGLMEMRGGWVIDLDISKFFDSLDHRKLREILDTRVRDGVIRKAIDKWLKAGVMTEGILERPASGTPQGGVISPILANIYLHEVLDSWFEKRVKPRLRGRAFMVRYADDAVLVFSDRKEAERVLKALEDRCLNYGLHLHPEKTRLVSFRRPPRPPGEQGTGLREAPRNLRFSRFHPLLGEVPSWEVACAPKDGPRQDAPRDQGGELVVRLPSPLASEGPTPVPVEGHRRPLPLLRDHRQQHSDRPLPARGPTGLAGVAEPAKPAGEDDVGAVSQAVQALSASSGHCLSLGLPCVAKPHSRGAGCGSPARPDLWGAWAGDRPGLPDSALLHGPPQAG